MSTKYTHSKRRVSNRAVSRLRQLLFAPIGAVVLLLLIVYLMGLQLSQAQAAASDGSSAAPAVQEETAAAPVRQAGRILYVTTDGAGTLCSIEQPCELQTAADEAVDGDEIRVAAGVYDDIQVTPPNTQTLRLEVSVLIEGGYSSANWTADPDPVANETILDGDDQARVIHIIGPISPTIRGFSIRNGQAPVGAGIYQQNAGGNALIENNKIYDNDAIGAGSQTGGGVYVGGGSIVRNNEIYGNTAAGRGGGVYVANNTTGEPATIEANEIYNNSTTTPSAIGGGVFIGGAGDAALINRNEIYQNSSNFGGGIGINTDAAAVVQNNIVHHNTAIGASASGGGLLSGGSATIWHNTFALNSAGTTGGGLQFTLGTAEIKNTIVASNTGGTNSGIDIGGANVTGSFNNVFNNGSNATLSNAIVGDPLFVNSGANDFHLTAASPNVNTGDDTVPVFDDFDGQGRPFDGGVEVGADEFYDPANTCYARFNNGPVFDNINDAIALVTQPADVVKVAGTCTGAGGAVLTLNETFILQGGYTTTNWIDRSFGPTTIDAEGVVGRRGILINGGSPTIDTLHITGGNLAAGNGAGIYVAAGSGTPVIYNTVLHGNTASAGNGALGIASGLQPVLQFNTVTDNTGDGVRFESASGAIHNSIVYDNSGTEIGGGTGHSFNLTNQDPLFVNPAQGDYHITIGSPALGAANPSAAGSPPTDDFDGDARPQGSTYDIGADESNQYPDLSFQPDFLERDVERGTTYTYTHILTNTGTITESYNLDSENTLGWNVTHPPVVLDLSPGESAVVEVTIDVPLLAPAGQVATTILTATASQNDNIYAVVVEETTAQPVPGVSFTPSYSQSLLPGTIVTYVHTLQNTGDFTDSFRVETIADPFDWATLLLPTDPFTIELATQAITEVLVQVVVPPFASAGFANTALIQASSEYSPSVSAVVTDTVTAKPTVGTRFVGPAGDDLNNNCTQMVFPCLTIRRGISQASFEDEVRVAPGIYFESNINVNDTISVTGGWVEDYETQQGPDATVIDAGQANRIFVVAPGSGIAPTFGNMTLQNGFSGSVGGAVWVRSSAQPHFNKIIFLNNRGTDGGAIYLDTNANVLVDQSRFINNIAGRSGGAIFVNNAILTAYNNLFDLNAAQQQGGALYFQSGQGFMEHNTINENTAVMQGGGVYNSTAVVQIFNTILVSNTASTGGAVFGAGGATTLNYNDIWNNSAPESNVPVGANSIAVDPLVVGPLLRLDPASPALDIAWPGTTVDVDFEDDPRPIDQGFDMGWDELSGCRAKRGDTIYGSIQGAVDASGPLLILVSGRCRGVHQITFDGQPISQTVHLTGNMTIQGGWDSEFEDRGDMTPTFVDPEGRGRAFFISGPIEVVLEDLHLVNNDATNLGGGPLDEDAGGALYNVDSTVVLSKVTVLTSTAALGGAIYNDDGDLSVTYAIEPAGNTTTVTRGLIENSTADLGSALYNNTGQMQVDSSMMHANTANVAGTVYNLAGELEMINSVLWHNSSAANGSGVYVAGGQAVLNHLTVYSNTAAGNGGGVYVANAADATVHNSIFQGNEAAGGSAIWVGAGAVVEVDYNYYHDQAAPAVVGIGEGPNSINSVVPPGLKNPENGDFHLLGGAAAEDHGDPASPVDHDFEGELRPSNQSTDMGADEIAGCLARNRRTEVIYGNPQTAVNEAIAGDWIEIFGHCSGVHTIDAGGSLGVISQTIHLTENINLSGGWNEDFSTQSPDFDSIIDAVGLGRVLYVGPGITSTIEMLHFTNGDATISGLDGNGGAVYMDNTQASLQSSEIYTNTAANGAGVYVSGGSAAIEGGNRIYSNTATNGAGIYAAGTVTVVNNFIYQNTASANGGGYYNSTGDTGFWHNDLVENTANNGGGLFVANGAPTIRSNIIISNTGLVGAAGAHGSGGAPSLGYNNFFANNGPNFGGTIPNGGPGSIAEDPLFVEPEVFNYRIAITSTMIDRGDPALPLTVDFEDDIRPSHQGFDIGADEIGGCFVRNLSLPDDIYGSPQLVVDLASHGDTVQIDGICFGVNGRIVNASTVSQTVFISKSLILDGEWDSPFLPVGTPAVLDAKMLGRTLYVDEGITVTVKNITLINGDANESGLLATGQGGNVYNTGDLVLDNVNVYSGTAVSGGGIYNAATGILHLQHSEVATNTASGNGAGLYHAGASLMVEKNDFYNNDAAVDGGGLYLNSSGSVTTAVQNNFIYRNNALDNGGGLYNVNTAAKIWHNTILENTAASSTGGGIHTQIGAGVVIRNNIVDSNIGTGIHANVLPDMGYNNVVGNVGGDYSGAAAAGTGAISEFPVYVNELGEDFHLEDDSPGVDVGDENSPIVDDYDGDLRPTNGGFDMGADEVNSCLIQVVDPLGINTQVFGVLQFAIDYAEQNGFVVINIARGECSGVRQVEGTWQVGRISTDLEFTGSLRRLDFSDPGDYDNPEIGTVTTIVNAGLEGRVLYVEEGAAPSFLHIAFVGGDAFASGGSTDGGAVYNAGEATFTESYLSASLAQNGGGYYGTATSLASFENSGERFNLEPPSLDEDGLLNSTIAGDNARVGRSTPARILENPDGSVGDVDSVVYPGNVAVNDGGGVYNLGDLYLTGIGLYENIAGNNGGAIYNSGIEFGVTNGVAYSNTAGNNGGGLYNGGVPAELINIGFVQNTAGGQGGGVYNQGDLDIFHNTIQLNVAANGGGGIYNTNAGLLLNSTIFYSNTTTSGTGGGLNSVGGPIPTYSNFFNNTPNDSTIGVGTNAVLEDPLLFGFTVLHWESPVIDQADPTLIGPPWNITFDHRGVTRPDGGTTHTGLTQSDIGAYEHRKDFGCAAGIYGPNIESLEVAPGETVTYTHNVTNVGNPPPFFPNGYTDTITITLSSSMDWASLVGGEQVVELGWGDSVQVEVRVTVPPGTAAGVFEESILMCQSKGIPSRSDTETNRTIADTLRSVVIEPDYVASAVPGDILLFTHTITNDGNISDTFRITPNSGPAHANATIIEVDGGPVTDTVFLEPLDSITITLQVEILDDATAGDVAQPGAVVRSETDVLVFDAAQNTINIGFTSGTRYVAAENSADTTNCTNFQSPCETLQHAVDQAVDGDAILLAAGIYTDYVTQTVGLQNVYIYKSVTIEGGYSQDDDYAVSLPITNAVYLDGELARRVVYVVPGVTTTLSSLFIRNGFAPSAPPVIPVEAPEQVPVVRGGLEMLESAFVPNSGGGVFNEGADLTLNGLWIQNSAAEFGGGVYQLDGRLHLNSVVLADNGNVPGTDGNGGGVYVANGEVLVENATFAANYVDGDFSFDESVRGDEDELLLGTGTGGGLYQAAGSLAITNTIFYSNSAAAFGAFFGPADTTNDYNLYFDNDLPETNVVTGSNSLTADPIFADLLYYHIDGTSPAFESGSNDVTLGFDIDRQPRLMGNAVDRGADEILLQPGLEFRPLTQTAVITTGELHTYTHILTNTGDFTDTYNLTMDNQTTGGVGWGYFLTPTVITQLPVGESVVVTFVITGGSPGYVDTTVITATSASDPAFYATVVDTTYISQTAGVDIGVDESGVGLPSETVTYVHTLTNTGDGPDTYSMTLQSPLPPGWNVTITPQTTEVVLPGAAIPFTVEVQIAADAISDTQYAAVIQATSLADTAVSDTLTDTTTVAIVYGLDLIPDHVGTGGPGTDVTYEHTVQNNSNYTDTITIDTHSDPAWTITPTTQVVEVGPFGTAEISITISIPPGTIGMVHTATLTATSSISPGLQAVATDITTVSANAGVAIGPDNASFADPGETVVYMHTVTNTGDIPDSYTLSAVSDQGWAVVVTPTNTPVLAPDATYPIVVTVTVPGGASPGQVDITTVTATSDFDGGVQDSATDTTQVPQTPGINFFPNNSGSAPEGTEISYQHTLQNIGDGPDTFALSGNSSNGWTTVVEPATVTLDPGESTAVTATLTIPGGTAGTIDVMDVSASSIISPAVSATVINTTTVTGPPGDTGVLLNPDNNGIGLAGNTIIYNHVVTNTGSASNDFAITAVSSNDWLVEANPSAVTLAAGASEAIQVTMFIPGATPGGTVDTMVVTATSTITPSIFDTAINVTTVLTEQVADVSIVPDNADTAVPGETVIYTHTVQNQGNSQDTINLEAVSNQGWTVTVLPSNVILIAGQQTDVQVSVEVPPGAADATVDVTTVTATSAFDPGVSDSAQDTTTVIAGGGTPVLFLPAVFKAQPGGGPTPTPTSTSPAPPTATRTPTPTATAIPCILTVPPAGNPPGVDLIVTNIVLVPANPQPGQSVSVRVTIKNQGQTDVTYGNNFYMDFYDNPIPQPPQPLQVGNIAWGIQGSDLEAGVSKTYTANYTFSAGFHRLWAQVDTDQTVNEANENNNLYGCKGVNVGGGQAVLQETPQPQPTADKPRATPTPGIVQEIAVPEPSEAAETPVP